MGFTLGEIRERTQAGPLRGIHREIACDCWFTSGGKTIPRLIKVMDEEGCLQTIPIHRVLSSEKKNYSGIRTIEHICQIPVGEREETVKLVFTSENCKWAIIQL